MTFRTDIQGIRAFAFLIVFIFHLNPNWLPGGFVGVDIFFVISGYLIAGLIAKRKEDNSFSFVDFYWKRIKRIIPALYFMLLITGVAAYFIYIPSDINGLAQALRKSFLFLSNQHFGSGASYFGAANSENPVLHTWSLSIEMQFYLFLPLFLIFIRNRYLIVASLIILTLCTLWSCYWLYVVENNTFVYFSLIARIPEFFVGVLASLAFSNKKFSKTTNLILSLIGVLLIVLSLLFIHEGSAFPGILSFLPTIGTGLLLISYDNPVAQFFSKKILVYIGELSYSLYLWHWPIIAFVRYKGGWAELTPFSIEELIFILIATVLLSVISYYLIEKPFRSYNLKRFAISFGGLSATVLAILLLLPVLKSRIIVPEEFGRSSFGQKSHATNKIETLGDLSANSKEIFLFGDSHALLLKYVLSEIGKEEHFKFKTITTSGYPALNGLNRSEIPQEKLSFYQKSLESLAITDSLIEESDVIVFNSIDLASVPSMEKALENLIENLDPDQSLVIFKTYPVLNRHPIKINGGVFKNTDDTIEVIYNERHNKIVEELDEKYSNVYSFDLSESDLFDEAPYHRNYTIYYDETHLNLYGTKLLLEDIGDELEVMLRQIISK
jgi:peptidoglycan/LPS O-acetylase OafA/YrhL